MRRAHAQGRHHIAIAAQLNTARRISGPSLVTERRSRGLGWLWALMVGQWRARSLDQTGAILTGSCVPNCRVRLRNAKVMASEGPNGCKVSELGRERRLFCLRARQAIPSRRQTNWDQEKAAAVLGVTTSGRQPKPRALRMYIWNMPRDGSLPPKKPAGPGWIGSDRITQAATTEESRQCPLQLGINISTPAHPRQLHAMSDLKSETWKRRDSVSVASRARRSSFTSPCRRGSSDDGSGSNGAAPARSWTTTDTGRTDKQ